MIIRWISEVPSTIVKLSDADARDQDTRSLPLLRTASRLMIVDGWLPSSSQS
jgi:hypothetical protein